jgi:hypothetical protein
MLRMFYNFINIFTRYIDMGVVCIRNSANIHALVRSNRWGRSFMYIAINADLEQSLAENLFLHVVCQISGPLAFDLSNKTWANIVPFLLCRKYPSFIVGYHDWQCRMPFLSLRIWHRLVYQHQYFDTIYWWCLAMQ